MEILTKLFGGAARVKILKLFLFNPSQAMSLDEVEKKSRVPRIAARKEIQILESIKVVKQKTLIRSMGRGKGKRKSTTWYLNPSFQYLSELQGLLMRTDSLRPPEILRRLRSAGTLKFVAISGIFLQNQDSRLDLVVVGDELNHASLERSLRSLESEIGKELRYAVFNTEDFQYRLNFYDKLVRDILEFPHHKLLNRINVQ